MTPCRCRHEAPPEPSVQCDKCADLQSAELSQGRPWVCPFCLQRVEDVYVNGDSVLGHCWVCKGWVEAEPETDLIAVQPHLGYSMEDV